MGIFSNVYIGNHHVSLITQIWRVDLPDGVDVLAKYCQKTKAICTKYSKLEKSESFPAVNSLRNHLEKRTF
jgi:hypothetical protein